MKIRDIVWIVIVCLALIVLFQNTGIATFHLFFWKIEMSQVIFAILLLVVGFVSGFVVGRFPRRRGKSGGEGAGKIREE